MTRQFKSPNGCDGTATAGEPKQAVPVDNPVQANRGGLPGEMIARVARVIGQKLEGWLKTGKPLSYNEIARTAIEAMREPTEAMLIAARDWSAEKYGKPIGSDAARGCWNAMHSAALTTEGRKP